MSPSALEAAIFRTVAFFSLMDLPLTKEEMHKWLLRPVGSFLLHEVEEALEAPFLCSTLTQSDAFFALDTEEGRRSLMERPRKLVDAAGKHRRALAIARRLRFMPGVRGIAVVNSLAWHATSEGSDIDFLIVTKKNALWTARLGALLPARLLRRRPGEARRDAECYSFFLREDCPSLSSVAAEDDVYLAAWCLSVSPLYDASGWADRFAKENAWVREWFPNAPFVRRAPAYRLEPRFVLPAIPFFDRFIERLQRRQLPKEIRDSSGLDRGVVMNESMLKFHVPDRRVWYRDELKRICIEAGTWNV